MVISVYNDCVIYKTRACTKNETYIICKKVVMKLDHENIFETNITYAWPAWKYDPVAV